MAEREALTAAYLRSILHYDPETGVFTWRERPREHFKTKRTHSRCNTMYAGSRAGSVNKLGYRVIGIGKRKYAEHRLAWLYMKGEWPILDIDHDNGLTADNRWKNLREATESQNAMNAKIRRDNKTGVKGVYPIKCSGATKYAVNVTANRKRVRIGTFDTFEEAVKRRIEASSRMHGAFSREA
jgi:hypothetical protein